MRRGLLLIAVLGTALGSGWVAAQTAPTGSPSTPPAKAEDKAATGPGTTGPGAGRGMQRPRMVGRGPMGEGMGMGGMCPLMVGPGTKVEVKKLPKGVTITLTNDNADTVLRLQKMAEAMRLMHEAHAP
jgi:hypothetical protein